MTNKNFATEVVKGFEQGGKPSVKEVLMVLRKTDDLLEGALYKLIRKEE